MSLKKLLEVIKVLFLLIPVFFGGSNLEAHTVFQRSENLSQSDTTLIMNLLKQGDQANISGDYALAKEILLRADSLSNRLDFSKGNEISASYLSDVYINEGNYLQAIQVLEDAIEAYPESKQRAQFHNLLGSAYVNISEYEKGINNFEASFGFVDRLPPEKRNRINLGLRQNLAVAYQNVGEDNLAFENYLAAIQYAEASKDTSMLTIAYNNLGQAYNNSSDYEKAVYYLGKSRELAEAKESKIDLYRAHLNLANAFSNQEEFEKALSNYETAEALHAELRPNNPPAIILHNRGSTLAKMKRYEEAEDLLKTSLAMAQDLNIKIGLYHNHHVLGMMYLEQEKSREAISHLEKAVKLGLESTNSRLIQESREGLYKAYAQANEYEDAFQMLRNYSSMSDSLRNLEKEKELADLQGQLEIGRQSEINRQLQEKQTQQESQLQVQLFLIVAGALVIVLIVVILFMMKKAARERNEINGQLQKQKTELEEANRDKDKLFAIIAHDLRSPLSSMQGVLYLIKENVLTKDDITMLAQELEVSVQKNVDVMEDLLAWAKEQLSGVRMDLSPVNVHQVVEEVISSQMFIANQKGVRIKQMVGEDLTVFADSNALQLVIRNLISNSIKFTKKGDEIEVSTESGPEFIKIKIKDTGIGIPAGAASKIFENKSWTREGTNKEKGSGFGLSLSKEFVERMNGEIWFESEEGNGSVFYIEIPKFESSAEPVYN